MRSRITREAFHDFLAPQMGKSSSMAVRRLLLIRHGQYDEREDGTKDLTETGRAQAKRIGHALRDDHIDAVYASTMLRARTTAALIAEERNLLVQSTPVLCECIPTKIAFYIP